MRTILLFIVFGLTAPVVYAQSYRGQAVPVVERANPVEFSRLRFLTLTFGHEGPMDAPLRTPPVVGREYFVEADVFGLESAASVRFELADANGRSLQTITMWKTSDSSSDGEFNGFFKVPDQPFRAVVTGTTTSGVAFRSSLNTVFQPSPTGPAEQLALPPGTPPDQVAQIGGMVAAYRQQLHTRAAQAAAEHPDGTITIARAVVSPITYEPLNSVSGAPIGMRLRYSIRFMSRQTVAAVPLVFPVYQQPEWRGVVEMKPLAGTITPAPQNVGVQSLQDVIVYRAAATYQAGTTYTFSVDMVPDYVFQGTQTGRFCIYEQKVTNRAVWDGIMGSQSAIPYSISISHTETSARVPAFLPQRVFHDAFVASGAFDCGPVPNIRF